MIKQKYLFKVIAIAIMVVMVVMVAVACQKKPTDINATVDVGEEVKPPEEPIQPEGPKVKIDPNGDLKHF